MIGEKFNKLLVLEECKERSHDGHKRYKCICDCGNITYVDGRCLRSNRVKSCGCLKHEKYNLKHGKINTRLYRILKGIKERCYKPYNHSYPNYGGRGITICDEWFNDFKSFYDWSMSHGYKDNLTIDRIDVNGNYSPDNCRWVDMKTQNNNKRSNIYLTYNGKTQTIKQWAEELNINYAPLYYRYNLGWNTKDTLFGRDV